MQQTVRNSMEYVAYAAAEAAAASASNIDCLQPDITIM